MCRVVGKRLGDLDDLEVRVADLDVDLRDLDPFTTTLPPVFYDRGALLCRLGPEWWRLGAGQAPLCQPALVAVAPGLQLDVPRVFSCSGSQLIGDGRTLASDIVPASLRVVAAARCMAWSCDRRWHIRGRDIKPATVSIDEDCDVLGPVVADRYDDPALLTRSPAGVLLRLHAESGVKTLTAYSGSGLAHALHLALPLLAIAQDDGSVEVVDFTRDERLMTLRTP